MTFKWKVNLDDDAVYDLVKVLEHSATFHGDGGGIGKEMRGLADRLRSDYAAHLAAEADAVLEGKGLWMRITEEATPHA